MSILVTGGFGFIGSNFVRRYMMLNPSEEVLVLDKFTYASNITNLNEELGTRRLKYATCDIADVHGVRAHLSRYRPSVIVNFAAESHVDNSIKDSSPFIHSNVFGTVNLLEQVKAIIPESLFVHISTDEVYGSLSQEDPAFTETTPYDPRSPYSASKAASDHFVMAYHHTHKLRTIITNCSNNYGPYQHAEKLIPTIIRKAFSNNPIPIYGSGTNIRDWLHVSDHCQGIIDVIERGRVGQKYNFGGGNQISNLEIARLIVNLCRSKSKIEFVEDRKGHDFRYDVNHDKVYIELGWKPSIELSAGLVQTVQWYRNNLEWLESCVPSASS